MLRIQDSADLQESFFGRTRVALAHPDRCVTQSSRNDLKTHFAGGEGTGKGVTKVMEPKPANDSGELLRQIKTMLDRRPRRMPTPVHEDAFRDHWPGEQFEKCGPTDRRDGHRRLSFRLLHGEANPSLIQINRAPRTREKVASPKSGLEGDDEERFCRSESREVCAGCLTFSPTPSTEGPRPPTEARTRHQKSLRPRSLDMAAESCFVVKDREESRVLLRRELEFQWLSDNGGPYTSTDTVLYAQTLGFRPVTTPAYGSESNGTAEAFVNTVKRDYVHGADLSDGETVIRQLPGWIDDCNRIAPHSSLGMRFPKEFRALNPQTSCV